MTRKLFVLNGPNLNMLGLREPELYGTATLDDVRVLCDRVAEELGFELFFAQSNAEHEIVEWVHDAFREKATVVINPAGFSFRSVPLLDALHMLDRSDRRGPHHEHPRPRCRPPALAHLVGGARRDRRGGRVRIRAGDPRRRPVDSPNRRVDRSAARAELAESTVSRGRSCRRPRVRTRGPWSAPFPSCTRRRGSLRRPRRRRRDPRCGFRRRA